MNIGDKIRSIREMKGLKQENLAEMLGITLLAYGNIERGKTDITIKRIEQIAEKLGVSLQDIVSHSERIANFFDQCNQTYVNVNTGHNKKQSNHNYDSKDLVHQIALQKLEIAKLKIELDKAVFETKYWQEKVAGK